MNSNSSAKASSGSRPEGANCKGLLYLSSSSKKGTAHNPLCLGLTRPQDQDNSVGDFAADVAKHGKALHYFKYACLGHSTYRNNEVASTSVGSGLNKRVELPRCSGLEILVEGRAPEATEGAKQRQLKESGPHKNEGAPVMPRPPSTIRPPSVVTGVSPEEFGTRFIRSAGLVAAAIKKNLSHVGNSIKEMVGDIFHSDGRGPK